MVIPSYFPLVGAMICPSKTKVKQDYTFMQLPLISKQWELGKIDLDTDGRVSLQDHQEVPGLELRNR